MNQSMANIDKLRAYALAYELVDALRKLSKEEREEVDKNIKNLF